VIDDEYEIHPLDRDYSAPVAPTPNRRGDVLYHVQLRKIGIGGFATGFLTVVLAGILVTNSPGGTWMESVGSAVHRFGMILILLGGVVFIVAYRLPHVKGKLRLPDGSFQWSLKQSYWALVIGNLIGFLAVALASRLSPSVNSPEVYVFFVSGSLTISCALMVTVVVWHRGFIRAYAIGVLVAILFNGISTLFMMGRFWQGSGTALLLANLAIILLSGLACGGYVCLLESVIGRKNGSHVETEP
jgi:hypothetical protein